MNEPTYTLLKQKVFKSKLPLPQTLSPSHMLYKNDKFKHGDLPSKYTSRREAKTIFTSATV